MGACIGFLWYNTHPAEVFMGDTGSLALGGALAAVAILLKSEFLLLLVGAVFVGEMMSVILQRVVFKYRKRRYGLEYAREHRITIAVMGCRVNGPGETDEADLGLWCGPNYVNLKRGGEALGQFPYDAILPKLKQELASASAIVPSTNA
jgi:hypothetical protein